MFSSIGALAELTCSADSQLPFSVISLRIMPFDLLRALIAALGRTMCMYGAMPLLHAAASRTPTGFLSVGRESAYTQHAY